MAYRKQYRKQSRKYAREHDQYDVRFDYYIPEPGKKYLEIISVRFRPDEWGRTQVRVLFENIRDPEERFKVYFLKDRENSKFEDDLLRCCGVDRLEDIKGKKIRLQARKRSWYQWLENMEPLSSVN